jgi:hypothetical protein
MPRHDRKMLGCTNWDATPDALENIYSDVQGLRRGAERVGAVELGRRAYFGEVQEGKTMENGRK